jgi:AcrR family transcriptional regulator
MTDVNRVVATARKRRGTARARIAAAAFRLFAANGYAATTMESIAREACVAVQTVYFTFHTKADVLIEAITMAGGGSEATPDVMSRQWLQDVVSAQDGARRFALISEHGSEIYRRIGPMFRAINAASSVDAEVDRAWQTVVRGRREGMRRICRLMADRGEFRDGMDPQLAADILFAIHRHELYLAFTDECGWSFERYKAWTYATLCRQLLPRDRADAALEQESRAIADVSFREALKSLPL